jgi:hypothetical protein
LRDSADIAHSAVLIICERDIETTSLVETEVTSRRPRTLSYFWLNRHTPSGLKRSTESGHLVPELPLPGEVLWWSVSHGYGTSTQ